MSTVVVPGVGQGVVVVAGSSPVITTGLPGQPGPVGPIGATGPAGPLGPMGTLNVMQLSQADYTALPTKQPNTIYVII